MSKQITVSNLNVTYFVGKSNEFKALENINLSIDEGEFIIFFGPSGCGKSTLLYSISGLEKNIEGDIVVAKTNLKQLSAKQREDYYRNTIGMVFQAYLLIPTLTVFQNIALPLVSAEIKPRERKARVMELLTRFGVDKQANKLPNELSGGQQQRVAICRAVVNNPSIVLADEPLGNLDSKSANEVMQLFKDLNLKSGKTVILVTHDPTYLDVANRVFFIKDGQLIDTKVNRALSKVVAKKVVDADTVTKVTSAKPATKELDFLFTHYSKLKSGEPTSLLRSYQVKNMVTLALADFSADDFDRLRERIEASLQAKDNFKQVETFLKANQELGGIGLSNPATAKLIHRLKDMAKELAISDKLPVVDSHHPRTAEVKAQEVSKEIALRRALFDELNIHLSNPVCLKIIDQAIVERARGLIDRKALLWCLDAPFMKGGAGLDKRLARKLSKRLEIVLMGHKEE